MVFQLSSNEILLDICAVHNIVRLIAVAHEPKVLFC